MAIEGKKILVVDSDQNVVRLLIAKLSACGYEVISSDNGTDAWQKVQEDRPDMVITEIDLPHKDGIELIQDIMNNPVTEDIPVIFLTRRSENADIFRGWMSGVASYLTKPFNIREVLTHVERIFQNIEEGPQPNGNW